jgi:fibronectin type 3 domain-containing protein
MIAWLAGSVPAFASQEVELTWNPTPGTNIAGYIVYFGTQSHAYGASITFANVTDVIIPGLQDGTTYYFAVSAFDGSGNASNPSTEIVYSTPATVSLGLQVQSTTAALQAVAVSWTPSPDSDVYGYAVFYGTQPGVYTNSSTFDYASDGIIAGLAGGATYYFAVAPIDSYGVGVTSSSVPYTVPNPQPIVLQAQTPVDASGVALSWNAITNVAVAGYNVYYGTQSGVYTNTLNVGDANNAAVHGLTSGQAYYFAVTAVDSYGNQSRFSNEAVGVAAPPVPLVLMAQGSTQAISAVDVSWTPSPDSAVYGYAVYYGTQSGVYTNSTTFYSSSDGLIFGLAAGVTYYFAVAAVDEYGVEAISSRAVACVVPAPVPIVLNASATASGIELTWNAITNEGIYYYNIYYGTQSGVYPDSTGFGAATDGTLHNLAAGQTYFFVVTAVDDSGNESPPSNQAVSVAPVPPPFTLQTQISTEQNGLPNMEIYSPSVVYGLWEVDSSTDLQNWVPYAYGFGPGNGDGNDLRVGMEVDPTAPPMFFRAIMNLPDFF